VLRYCNSGKRSVKLAGKPGSVRSLRSRQPFLWARNYSRALATYPQARRDASSLAYLVLLRVEVAAFHPRRVLAISAVSIAAACAFRCDRITRAMTGLVSVALFLASRRTAVSRHPTLWSPDFPLAERERSASDCLADSRRDFNTRGMTSLSPRCTRCT
jgi:hypothetical protein